MALGRTSASLSGDQLQYTTEYVTITNNVFFAMEGQSMARWWSSTVGNDAGPQPGVITIAGNTCAGPIQDEGLAVWDIGQIYLQQSIVFQDNIIANHDGSRFMDVHYAPSAWIADGNVFDGIASFHWDGDDFPDLSSWQGATGGDQISRACTPLFSSPAAGDYHLDPGDLCARDSGVDITTITGVDMDGDPRSPSAPDIGADEVR